MDRYSRRSGQVTGSDVQGGDQAEQQRQHGERDAQRLERVQFGIGFGAVVLHGFVPRCRVDLIGADLPGAAGSDPADRFSCEARVARAAARRRPQMRRSADGLWRSSDICFRAVAAASARP